MQTQVLQSVAGSTETLQTHFGHLTQGLSSLNEVLGQLGGQQVVVQQVEPERRGWFGRRKRNGKG